MLKAYTQQAKKGGGSRAHRNLTFAGSSLRSYNNWTRFRMASGFLCRALHRVNSCSCQQKGVARKRRWQCSNSTKPTKTVENRPNSPQDFSQETEIDKEIYTISTGRGRRRRNCTVYPWKKYEEELNDDEAVRWF